MAFIVTHRRTVVHWPTHLVLQLPGSPLCTRSRIRQNCWYSSPSRGSHGTPNCIRRCLQRENNKTVGILVVNWTFAFVRATNRLNTWLCCELVRTKLSQPDLSLRFVPSNIKWISVPVLCLRLIQCLLCYLFTYYFTDTLMTIIEIWITWFHNEFHRSDIGVSLKSFAMF